MVLPISAKNLPKCGLLPQPPNRIKWHDTMITIATARVKSNDIYLFILHQSDYCVIKDHSKLLNVIFFPNHWTNLVNKIFSKGKLDNLLLSAEAICFFNDSIDLEIIT